MSQPTGTLTFLLTDVQGSTQLWERSPQAMQEALDRHDSLAESIVETHGGRLVKSRGEGDSLFAVFARTTDAAQAALTLQAAFASEPWPTATPLSVRMALHTGEVQLRDGDYYGQAVNRCARLRALGSGGQILLSLATEELVRDLLPPNVCLRDLGEQRLRDLSRPERVFQISSLGFPDTFPPLKSLDALPNNLPRQLTSFVGREAEMTQVKKLLSATCLLTLTGEGGSGKSRLSLQIAADLLEEFPDGVWLAELAPLSDPAHVPSAIASPVGVCEEPGKPLSQTLAEAWKAKRLLLILDNCEHLIEACARLADSLLRACPHVTILATSRETLNIPGETVWRVPTLSLPSVKPPLPPFETLNQYEAIRLFLDRVESVQPSFAVTAQNAPAIAQICSRLDGIPLAIELAAARVKVLTPEQISARLDDQFHLLTGGSRTALPRQQTLRALIDWSYTLLSDQEKILLRRLSIFTGGWTLEAAEAVCASESLEGWGVLDALSRLVERSLVVVEESGERYRLLETIRQYAQEKLMEVGESEGLRRPYVDHFIRFAEEAKPHLLGSEQTLWFARLEADMDNLRASLDWCAATESAGQAGLRLTAALYLFYEQTDYAGEGRKQYARALAHARATEPTQARAEALVAAGVLANEQRARKAAKPLLEEGLSLSRQTDSSEATVEALFHLSFFTPDGEAMQKLQEESLALAREIGDRRGIGNATYQLAIRDRDGGDLASARRLMSESMESFQKAGVVPMANGAMSVLGEILIQMGEVEAGQALGEKAAYLRQSLGITDDEAATLLLEKAEQFQKNGNHEAACSLMESRLITLRARGDGSALGRTLDRFIRVSQERGDFITARRLAVENVVHLRESGRDLPLAWALLRVADDERDSGLGDFGASHYAESLALAADAFLSSDTLRRETLQCVVGGLTGLALVSSLSKQPWRTVRLRAAAEARTEALLTNTAGWRNRDGWTNWVKGIEDRLAQITMQLMAAPVELGEEAYATCLAEGRAMTLEQAVEYALKDA